MKWDIAWKIAACFELIGAKVEHSGDYPGWEPLIDSNIKNITIVGNNAGVDDFGMGLLLKNITFIFENLKMALSY